MTSEWNWSPKNPYGPGGEYEINDQSVVPDPAHERILKALVSGDPQAAIANLEALRGTGFDGDIDYMQACLRDEANGVEFYEWLGRNK